MRLFGQVTCYSNELDVTELLASNIDRPVAIVQGEVAVTGTLDAYDLADPDVAELRVTVDGQQAEFSLASVPVSVYGEPR